jgi:Bifunctional DNA primase/polymerase, N-terminal
MEVSYDYLPATVTARTPSGGRHFFFSLPKQPVRFAPNGIAGYGHVEIPVYVQVPPSVRPGVGEYRWVSPVGTGLAPMPEWLLSMLDRTPASASIGEGPISDLPIDNVPAETYLADFFGIDADPRTHKAICPDHDDNAPTLHVYPYRWYCSACGCGGRIAAAAAKHLGLGAQDGHRWDWSGYRDEVRTFLDAYSETL